jgi:hypothetical protein
MSADQDCGEMPLVFNYQVTNTLEILRFAQDFACGLPLRSRPQKRLNLPNY